jgi:hypothetical protein
MYTILLALALSQGTIAKEPPSKAAVAQPQTQAEPRGSKAAPLVVEVVRTPGDSAEARRQEAHQKDQSFYEMLTGVGTVALAAITFLLAIGTVVLAVFTYSLWQDAKVTSAAAKKSADQTERSVNLATDNAIHELRAYVFLENEYSVQWRIAGMPLEVTVKFKNFGQTPAHDLTVTVCIDVGTFPLAAPLPICALAEGMPRSKGILGPQAGVESENKFPVEGINFNTPPNAPPMMAYVHGVVTYKDVFGYERTTRFRHMIAHRSDKMTACPEGNEYT